MKRILSLLICTALLFALAACANTAPGTAVAPVPTDSGAQSEPPASLQTAAPAAEPSATPAAEASLPVTFREETPVSLDLDGDGSMEKITVSIIPEQDGYLEKRLLTVTPESGEPATLTLDISDFFTGFVCDVNNDGSVELLVSGDIESCDFSTWMMRYVDGELVLAVSPYESGLGDDWLPPSCSGSVMAIQDGVVIVEDSIDILGTWGASTQYLVSDEPFRLERVAGSVWTRDASWIDAQYWEYCTLTTTRELPVTFDGESTPSALEAGVKIAVMETDYETYVTFITEDGRKGSIAVAQDTENWGWTIDGVHETEYFEMIPYAG